MSLSTPISPGRPPISPTPTGPAAHTVLASPVGDLTLAATGTTLTGLWMERHRRPAGFDLGRADPGPFAAVRAQLEEYFVGARTAFDVDVAPHGAPFAQRVWALLREIPYGRTCTYGDLARRLGAPGAAQAVGAANGANPVSIVIPCHRVVGADGALTGYAGGVEVKARLLALEQSRPDPDRLF